MHKNQGSSGATCGTNLFNTTKMPSGWKSRENKPKNVSKQHDICVTKKEGVEQQLKGMANWKAQGPEKVHAYCTKNFITALHNRIAEHLQSLFDYWKRSWLDGIRQNQLGYERWNKSMHQKSKISDR